MFLIGYIVCHPAGHTTCSTPMHACGYSQRNAGIETVKAKEISAILSRGQVTTLIDVVNSTRGKDEQKRIAENLQGIFDSRTARHLGQSVWRSKGEFAGTAREDNRNENISEGVSINPGRQSGGGSDQVQMRDSRENNLKEGGEKQTANEAPQEQAILNRKETP